MRIWLVCRVTWNIMLQYKLILISRTTFLHWAFAVVNLPSPHHQWSVANSSVARVDSIMGLTYALNLGVTNTIVEDTRVAGHIQVSSLNVVLPESLSLYMTPLSSSGDPVKGIKEIPSMTCWYGVSGRRYLIQMKVFSEGPDAQEIYITEVKRAFFQYHCSNNDISSYFVFLTSRVLSSFHFPFHNVNYDHIIKVLLFVLLIASLVE